MSTYTFPKQITKEIPDGMQIFFKNGDYLQISDTEILEFALDYYDNLAWFGNCAARVCHGGFFKLKIQKGGQRRPRFLHDERAYENDGAGCIERRLTEGGISHVRIFNENRWSHIILGDASASVLDGVITVAYRHNELNGAFTGSEYKISLPSITKNVIEKINISFENCDGIEVFGDEILDINLNFSDRLEWEGDGYSRRVRGGYILLRFDPGMFWRRANIYPDWTSKKGIKPLLRRICGKGVDEVDITHLYIEYQYAGYGVEHEERIDIPSINASEYPCYDFEGYVSTNGVGNDFSEYDDFDHDDYDDYVSGYAKLCKDKSLLITFGKLPEKDNDADDFDNF